jgi:phage FluMu protein Com
MSEEVREIRCSGCGKLLAKVCGRFLIVQRGDLQVTFDGEFRASFVCSRPGCRRLNLVQIESQEALTVAFRK